MKSNRMKSSMENIVSEDDSKTFHKNKKQKNNVSNSGEGSGSGSKGGGGGGGSGEGSPAVSFSSPTTESGGATATDHQVQRSSNSSTITRSGSANSSSGNANNRSRMRSSGSILSTASAHGSVSLCGRRREMEDVVAVELGFFHSVTTMNDDVEVENENDQIVDYDFYAVYDGHGGFRVAQLCRERLHQVLANEILERTYLGDDGGGGGGEAVDGNWESVMKSCFMKMDEEIIGCVIEEEIIGESSMRTTGSTAVVAVLSNKKLVVANCGDSRAVLCRGGVALPLSTDHKPDRPDEMERVEAAGGRVINWDGFRVLGVLATSRSIGDHYLKPYVISEPEVIVMERTTNDEFLILASDGLWDVMSNEVACDVVRKCLDGRIVRRLSTNVQRNNVGEAAAVLAELAMARGSKDNISAVIVELK